MGRIPDATKREIRDRVDIVSLIAGYGVELKQAGSSFKGLCPFHNEKTPSFNVTPDRGTYYCFGCQQSGDVFAFVQEKDNVTFPEAAHRLARAHGIQIPESAGPSEDRVSPLFDANEKAQAFYRENLASPGGAAAREYLEGRGFDLDTAAHYGLGFAPNRWDALGSFLERAGIPFAVAERAGLLAPAKQAGRDPYDRFRGRLTFPILDVHQRVIAFGARALESDQQPKYLNSPETPVFLKRKVFYGLSEALEAIRKTKRAILSEGYFDRIALDRAGLGESLATCGTALGAEHAEELRRRRLKEVVLLFAGDAAGYQALERALLILLPSELRVRGISLPDGHDPDSYRREKGDQALRELVDEAPEALEIVTRKALSTGVATPSQKADIAEHLAGFAVLIPNPVERDEHARRIAMAIGADPAAVQSLVRKARRPSRSSAEQSVGDRLIVKPRQVGPAQKHLARIVSLVARDASLARSALRPELESDVLPESAWKSLLRCLLEAADQGQVDAKGQVDFFAVQDRLDEDLTERLHQIAVDDLEVCPDVSFEQELLDLLDWFKTERRRQKSEALTQKLEDPAANAEEVLAEKQRLLEERRAAQRVDPGAGA